jgi:hypothetical protein
MDTTGNKTGQKKGRVPKYSVRFANYSPEEAGGDKSGLSARSRAAQLYNQHLKLNAEQSAALDQLYASNGISDILFKSMDNESQSKAQTLLAAYRLSLDAREDVGSRWSVKWGRTSGKSEGSTQRVLYQWFVLRLSPKYISPLTQ